MPFHIKSVAALGGDIYYKADGTWTQTYADRKQYSNKSDADTQAATQETKVIKNTSGAIVSSYSYQLDVYKNSSVITE